LDDRQSVAIESRRRPRGDNLYADSLVALDADTGKLKWHFQFTQHDEHDYDATQVPVMIDDGDRKLIAQANRNGFFYVLDRTNGKLISATSYAKVTWSTSKDAAGRPVPDRMRCPRQKGIACVRELRDRRTGCRRRTIRRRNSFM